MFYKQKFGLPMGSPLSEVLACIYLEFLEYSPLNYIIPNTVRYFRFIDDICRERKISYFGLARNLIRHLISTNQDDLSYSARTFISAHQIL